MQMEKEICKRRLSVNKIAYNFLFHSPKQKKNIFYQKTLI